MLYKKKVTLPTSMHNPVIIHGHVKFKKNKHLQHHHVVYF